MTSNTTNKINKLEKKNKRYRNNYNRLMRKSKKLSEIYLSDKKLREAKYHHSLYVLIIPTIIALSLIIHSLYLGLITQIMVFVSTSIGLGAIIMIPSICAITGGYKGILSKRLSYIDNKIMELQTKMNDNKQIINNLKQKESENLEQSRQEKTWDDVYITEEEIRQYMPESPAPFSLEEIFGTSDNTEEHTTDSQQEQRRFVKTKKLVPPKHTGNK